MSLIDSLDILPGLEEAFFKIFNLGNNGTQSKILVQSRTVSRRRAVQLELRSLMVLWQPLYNALGSTCKAQWEAYWLTLPFGGHGGANGWPGSGFSAFIYFNAPRKRLGLPLYSCYAPPPTTWSDDFESYSLGSIDGQGAWHTGPNVPPDNATLKAMIEDTLVHSGTRALKMTGDFFGGGIAHKVPGTNLHDHPRIKISFYTYPPNATACDVGINSASGSTFCFEYQLFPGIFSQLVANGAGTLQAGPTINAWNFVELELDNVLNKVRSQINGGGWSTWLPYYSAFAGDQGMFGISNGGSAGPAFDDLVVIAI